MNEQHLNILVLGTIGSTSSLDQVGVHFTEGKNIADFHVAAVEVGVRRVTRG